MGTPKLFRQKNIVSSITVPRTHFGRVQEVGCSMICYQREYFLPCTSTVHIKSVYSECLLRIENCEQGTLRCNGKTDKLCVGRDTVGYTRGSIAPVQSQTINTLVLILRLICLLLAHLLRVRRHRMIKGTWCSGALSCLGCRRYPRSLWDTESKRLQWLCLLLAFFP